jgi:hypothetical protein
MRAIVSGLFATALYTLVIATLISMAMPTQARVEAYIEAAHEVTGAVAPEIGTPLAG